MFDVEEIALISQYIKLYTNNGKGRFFADFFRVSDSCKVILDQLDERFAPKFSVLKNDPFEDISKDELIKGRSLIMKSVRRDFDWLWKTRKLEEYLENSIRGKEELWGKIIAFFDENDDRYIEYYDGGRSPKFAIRGNRSITLSAKNPYIRINLLSEYDDDIRIDVDILSIIEEGQTNKIILEDKLTELEEIEKWVDEKIEDDFKYIKDNGLDKEIRHS